MTRAVLLRSAPALLVLLAALAGPWLAPHPVDEPVTAPFAEPGAQHVLGADALGRDVLSRVLTGGRDLLAAAAAVAVVVTGLAALLAALGAVRPRVRAVVEHVGDFLILIPSVLAILVIGTSFPGAGRLPVVLAAIVLGVPFAVRVASAAAGPLGSAGFVEVARARGDRPLAVACGEILPNLRTTLLALLGLRFVDAVYVVATAGFLQVGVQPPAPDWAVMIRENAEGILLNPWAVAAPGAAIAVLAVSTHVAFDLLLPQARNRTVSRL